MAKKVSKKVSKKEEQMSEKTERAVLVLLVIIIILLAIILGIVILKKNNNIVDSNDTNYKVNIDDNADGIKVTDEILYNQNSTTTDKKYIGKDSAISIALKDLKLTQNDVYDLECELDQEFNQTVYEVTFNYKNLEYEYYINPETGKIIHSFKELD